ncbi:MAG: protein kinase, partial [Acidobacteriota bacterium]
VAEVLSAFEAERTEKMDLMPSATISKGFEPGTLFNGRYEITHLLGKGGMGEVYHAIDTRIKRYVALKVLHSDHVSSKEGLRRFALEAQAVSALNHPHIMTVYEFEKTAEGTLFIVAEYVDGKTLNEHLSGGRLNPARALEIAIQVSSALSAAHDAGITHRDIKPENIMVRRDGYVKVLDFGLAKLSADPNSSGSGPEDPTQALHKTKPGAVMGTAAYMSPEQARGLNVDERTDVWSLGVVIYEMLAGHRPFWGETSTDIIVSVLQREPPPLVFYAQDLDPELESIVGKTLAKKAAERYQTSGELRIDLEKVRKRIEYDNDLGRSTDPDSTRKFDNGEIKTALENGIPTAGDVAETTSGGTAGPRSFWPFRSAYGRNGSTLYRGIALVIGTITLIALLAYGIYYAVSGSRTGRPIDSIAVLPFENLTGDPGFTYASDGVSESLIDRLSQLPQLKVISRSSSFKFRGQDLDLNDAAAKLGARAIITGNVAKIGEDLLIRVDVVDAAENRHLLGGQYRRKVDDLLNIQNEIAQLVTEQLRVKLTDLQSTRLANRDTMNSEAYRYYLSGLVELNGPDDVRGKALEYFEHAVQLDPNFAQAHAEIAWINWQLAEGAGNPYELMPKARTAVDRALAIDPNLADAHVILAGIKEYEFDWAGAEREYQRAIGLNPNLDLARNNYAFFLSTIGRQSDALAQLEQQSLRDPINLRMGLLQ